MGFEKRGSAPPLEPPLPRLVLEPRRPQVTRETRREEAIARALRDSHARLSAGLLQPGLFDRHAERAAAAQTSRVDEAVAKSRARLTMLHRSRRLRLDERVVVFGVIFCP